MDVESSGERSGGPDDASSDSGEQRTDAGYGAKGPLGWFKATNHSPGVVAFVRRARRALPGDPDFGDPLSAAGVGGPRAAARAADRLLDRDAASREVSLGALQVWQAITERVSGRPANPEVTLVFTDLVGFSDWALRAGDDATLRLLRRVTQVMEPPILAAGGQIVKRMGDGAMAVFDDPVTAVEAVLAALDAVKGVDVDGYTPRVRAGMHTGRPQRIGSDWLGVDVNVAARDHGACEPGWTRGVRCDAGADPAGQAGVHGRLRQTCSQADVLGEDRRRAGGSRHVLGEATTRFVGRRRGRRDCARA